MWLLGNTMHAIYAKLVCLGYFHILCITASSPTTMFGRRTLFATLITVLATVALGVSAYLTWVTWESGTVLGCTADSLLDCDDVLASRWSKWLGLPVSLLGGMVYVTILGLVWPAASCARGMAVTALLGISMLAAGAAVWFVGVQALQLESFCAYCLTAHACGLCIGVLSLLLFLDSSSGSEVDQARSLLGVAAADSAQAVDEPGEPVSVTSLLVALSVAAVGLVGLMGGQLLVEPEDNSMPMEEIVFEPNDVAKQEQPQAGPPQREAESPQPDVGLKQPEVEPQQLEQPVDEELATAAADQDDDLDWLESDGTSNAKPSFEGPDTIGSVFGAGPPSLIPRAFASSIDPRDMPVIGNPDAKHIVVEMMDYTCSHCRDLHPHLQAAVKRYGDQLGIVVYNVPLSRKCNQNVKKDTQVRKYACDYAQFAIGVWKLAPASFAEYHYWLLEGEKPPGVNKAKNRARKLAGNQLLLDKALKADTARRISIQVEEFQRTKTGLPILFLPTGKLRGVPKTSEQLFEILETQLGIQPQ